MSGTALSGTALGGTALGGTDLGGAALSGPVLRGGAISEASPPSRVRRSVTPAVRRQAPAQVVAEPGPVLLAGVGDGPSLSAHRARFGALPTPDLDAVLSAVGAAAVAGRGGAGFPFARKVAAAAAGKRRHVVVVNLSEGEPASAKDTALALLAPHQILDGAEVVARALRTKEIHVVTPQERPAVADSIARAVDERAAAETRGGRGGPRWQLHSAAPGFVSGQAQAVLELLAGRPGLPVTAWQPEAISGLDGRPTLLSNAETWAQVAAVLRLGPLRYAAHGTFAEPGTTLLTLPHESDPDTAVVVETAYGTPWVSVLGAAVDRPVLLGGFHGTWAGAGVLAGARVSRVDLQQQGLTLGAGVVLPLPTGQCPIAFTWEIVDYLAGQSAQRCGPCRNGLPALAAEVGRLATGNPAVSWTRIAELVGLVERRGACAHPDGTARLVRSMLTTFDDEVGMHLAGRCGR